MKPHEEYKLRINQEFSVSYDPKTDLDTIQCSRLVFESEEDLNRDKEVFKEGLLATIAECAIYRIWTTLQELLSHDGFFGGDKAQTAA